MNNPTVYLAVFLALSIASNIIIRYYDVRVRKELIAAEDTLRELYRAELARLHLDSWGTPGEYIFLSANYDCPVAKLPWFAVKALSLKARKITYRAIITERIEEEVKRAEAAQNKLDSEFAELERLANSLNREGSNGIALAESIGLIRTGIAAGDIDSGTARRFFQGTRSALECARDLTPDSTYLQALGFARGAQLDEFLSMRFDRAEHTAQAIHEAECYFKLFSTAKAVSVLKDAVR